VDFLLRQQVLDNLQAQTLAAGSDRRALAGELLDNWVDGRVKMYVTRQLLHCRRRHPGLFSRGEYLPLMLAGTRGDHVFAFARRLGEKLAVVILPRLCTRLAPDGTSPTGEATWLDTRCLVPYADPNVRLCNVFTGEPIEWETRDGIPSLRIASALADFPIAMFMRDGVA
jgi:(1->4)-alpha-D-glucan 1-alpha-D-glucosylmutase